MQKLFLLSVMASVMPIGASIASTCVEVDAVVGTACKTGYQTGTGTTLKSYAACGNDGVECFVTDCADGCVCSPGCATFGGVKDKPSMKCPTRCPDTSWGNIDGATTARPAETTYPYQSICVETSSGGTACQYRCRAGYYGTAKYESELPGVVDSNGTFSGCTKCPSSGRSKAGDNATITRCYLSSGGSFSGDIGSGTYVSDCYYTE